MNIIVKNYKLAEEFFLKAYGIKSEDSIAAQLGYLYDIINEKHKAYQYFKKSAYSKDKKLALSSQQAMTNLQDGIPNFYPILTLSISICHQFTLVALI